MVFNRQDRDVVLARFCIDGDSGKTIRFVKRRGKLLRIDDINTYKDGLHHRIDRTIEIDPLKMLELINDAINATTRGDLETYEIWINYSINKELWS